MAHVTIEGRDFDLDKLSGEARQQAMNINLVDQEIRRLGPAENLPDGAQCLRDGIAASVTEGSVRRREVGCEHLHLRQQSCSR